MGIFAEYFGWVIGRFVWGLRRGMQGYEITDRRRGG